MNKKGQIESNPFGFTTNQSNSEELDVGWGEEESTNLNSTNNNQSANDFFAPKQNNNNNDFFANQNQNQNNPFGNNNNSNDGMSGMINLSGDNNNNQQQTQQAQPTYNEYGEEEEPPLLEDLGINLELIKSRMISVIKLKKCDEKFLVESDMSGPLILGFTLGFFMMLSGKIHFGYIYGFGICGTISLYLVLNWLAQHRQIELYNVLSILGYCLLPIVMLSFFSVFINLVGVFGGIMSIIAIAWATYTASTFFEEVLELNHQKYLAAYPIFLFYFTFVLITIF